MDTWNWIILTIMVVWLIALWTFPSVVLHPFLTIHRLRGHEIEIYPIGYVDFDWRCSCGKQGEY